MATPSTHLQFPNSMKRQDPVTQEITSQNLSNSTNHTNSTGLSNPTVDELQGRLSSFHISSSSTASSAAGGGFSSQPSSLSYPSSDSLASSQSVPNFQQLHQPTNTSGDLISRMQHSPVGSLPHASAASSSSSSAPHLGQGLSSFGGGQSGQQGGNLSFGGGQSGQQGSNLSFGGGQSGQQGSNLSFGGGQSSQQGSTVVFGGQNDQQSQGGLSSSGLHTNSAQQSQQQSQPFGNLRTDDDAQVFAASSVSASAFMGTSSDVSSGMSMCNNNCNPSALFDGMSSGGMCDDMADVDEDFDREHMSELSFMMSSLCQVDQKATNSRSGFMPYIY